MTTAYLRKHLPFLIAVQRSSGTERVGILHNCTNPELKFLSECCANILSGNTTVTRNEVLKLRRVKATLRLISTKKTASFQRRKLLAKLPKTVLTLIARSTVKFLTKRLNE